MTTKASLKFSVVAGMTLLCANAWAGLGKIHVSSNLGEPLRAEIPITGADLNINKIGLAGPDAFREFQVDYSGVLSSLRFTVVRRGSGAVVRVTSSQPINEPFLRFVLEAQSNSSRSVREYTVLLDPPDYAIRQPERIEQDVPAYADEHLSDRYRGRVRDQFGKAGAGTGRPGELRATPGATLAGLASRVKPHGVSLTQTMAALVQANPRAFINGNPNQLLNGAVLKVPPAVMVKAISQAEAKRILAGQGSAAPEHKEAAAKEPPTVPALTVHTPAAPSKQASGVLKLMPAGEANAATDARLNDLENQVAARDKTLKSAEERIAALEAQLRSLKGGVAPAAPVASSASAPVVAHAPASAPEAAHPVPASAPAHVVKPVVHPAVIPEPPAPSWTDRLLDNLPLVGGGAAAVLLAALLGVAIKRRRGGPGKPSTKAAVAGATARAPAAATPTPTSGHSFMSDFTRSFGEIDAGEVDPIAEAEVYIAYGRDEQAEEILKDALGRDPARHEVRMKLLEIYANREDKAGFERVARELHAAFDGKGQLWAKAAVMGQTVDPGNPLYQTVESAAPTAAPTAPIEPLGGMIDLDQELMGMQPQQPIEDLTMPEDLAPDLAEPTAEGLPVDVPEDELRSALFGEEAAVEAPAPENMLDFDLDSLAAEAAQSATEEEKPAETSANMLDFDFPLDEMAEKAAAEPEPEKPIGAVEEPLGDFASLYDAEPTPPAEEPVGITVSDDPLSTKLDLAKVYLDMGDSEGAREVLKELVEESQGPLKDEAMALLAKLGG